MTLKEKFDKVEIMFESQIGFLKYDELGNTSNQCEVIADGYVIEFGNWLNNKVLNKKGIHHELCGRLKISQLLLLFKQDKEL